MRMALLGSSRETCRGQSPGAKAREKGGRLCSHSSKDRAEQPLEGAMPKVETAGLFLFMEEMKPWADGNLPLKQPYSSHSTCSRHSSGVRSRRTRMLPRWWLTIQMRTLTRRAAGGNRLQQLPITESKSLQR